ncbi:EAL domain-containing protein [Paraburkholderia xenovorans]|uniref:EAL domain-containing protein n=1 Tax=Paraburkholderia xenovorans TaxID=36873 RepID=UPI0038B8AF10
MTAGSLRRLTSEVRRGVQAGEFRIAYQPIVGSAAGNVRGAEALLRWQHPEYGLLLPGAFADALDDPVTTEKVTCFVLDRVCHDIAELGEPWPADRYVSINIDPCLLHGDFFAQKISKRCEQYQIDPSMLMLEVLESENLLTVCKLNDAIASLQQLGVRLALDDFGTGFSSLARLAGLPIDTVKLARELLCGVPSSHRSRMLIAGVINLLNDLQVEIIVEGVETLEQAIWLRQFPDIRMQGFFFRRPVVDLLEAVQSIAPILHLESCLGQENGSLPRHR